MSSLTGCAALAAVALYQTGVWKRLPGPRSGLFDAAQVNGSDQAYSLLQTPDAVLGLASYSITMSLIAMGPADRSRSAPAIPLAMGLKALLDAACAGKLSVDQWTKHRAFSLWSMIAAGAALATLAFTLPEAAAATKRLQLSKKCRGELFEG